MFLIATALGNRLRRRRRIFILVCGAVLLLRTLLHIKHMSPTTIVGPPGSTESADAKHILGLMPVSAANVECSQPLPQSGSDKNRGLTVQKWFDLCGTAVENLRQSPLFPLFPHVVHHTCHFKPELNGDSGYAQRIFGFLHPPASGRYRFAIFSDGGSELWLSSDHRPANAKLLALVSLGSSPTWPTVHGDTSKYPSPISKEIYLEGNGTYFIEALHQQGSGDRHIMVYWEMPGSTCFAVVHEAFLSPSHPRLDYFTDAPKHRKESPVERRFMDNSAVELANKREINMALPTCDYEPSFIVRRPLKRYEGARLMRLVHPASVYPDDQTAFKSAKTENWSRGNERVDQGKAQVVAQKFIKAMEVRWPGKYVLQGIIGMQQTIDEAKGDRFLIELRLGLRAHSNASVRMSKYVFLARGADDLCFPKGYEVNRTTNVYFILPVKNQGGWLHHFLKEITRLYRKTKDDNFFVNLVDFESDDVDVAEMIRASGVSEKINFISKTGPFHKTLAIQDAASRVPSPDDIVFLFDLHMDIPLNLLENVRKYTVQGKMAYSPVVGRLNCGNSRDDPDGFWQLNGFGLTAVYKSDWDRFKGMNVRDFTTSWGGEDWDLVDRILGANLEILQLKQHGLLHHFHSRNKMWNHR